MKALELGESQVSQGPKLKDIELYLAAYLESSLEGIFD
jgi:hypothetical protein